MDTATELRIVFALCLTGLVIALVTLSAGLDRSDLHVVAVSLALIGIVVGTGIAAWRSGTGGSETDDLAWDGA